MPRSWSFGNLSGTGSPFGAVLLRRPVLGVALLEDSLQFLPGFVLVALGCGLGHGSMFHRDVCRLKSHLARRRARTIGRINLRLEALPTSGVTPDAIAIGIQAVRVAAGDGD